MHKGWYVRERQILKDSLAIIQSQFGGPFSSLPLVSFSALQMREIDKFVHSCRDHELEAKLDNVRKQWAGPEVNKMQDGKLVEMLLEVIDKFEI